MKIKTLGYLIYEKNKKLEKLYWHEWFAWYPVSFNGYLVWMVNIERYRWRLRGRWQWDYRIKKD